MIKTLIPWYQQRFLISLTFPKLTLLQNPFLSKYPGNKKNHEQPSFKVKRFELFFMAFFIL